MESLVQGFSDSVFDQRYMGPPLLSRGVGQQETAVSVSPLRSSPCGSSERDASEEEDYSDATLKLISQMLMEEDDLVRKPCMFQDCLALQATEKSFYDVLEEPNQHHLFDTGPSDESPDDNSPRTSSSESSSNSSVYVNNFIESNWVRDQEKLGSSSHVSTAIFESILQSITPSNGSGDGSVDSLVSPFQVPDSSNQSQPPWLFRGGNAKFPELVPNMESVNFDLGTKERTSKVDDEAEKNRRDNYSPNGGSREKKTRYREDGDNADGSRSNKQLASYAEESDEELEKYDKVLLCPRLNPHLHQDSTLCLYEVDPQNAAGKNLLQNGPAKGSNGGKARGKRQGNKKEVVDLRSLLSLCAQAVGAADIRTATELLKQIRQHSSPYGDGSERLAHYFAEALQARLEGTGASLYAACTISKISAADFLKAYRVYVQSCPFNKMSNMYANRSIGKLVQNATRLHIIHFGVLYGFQWPCLIQHLSVRPGGPPKIRITGIEFPQPGLRPAERVEETGRRLATYCQRFNVEFEYSAIAKRWETIELKELKIDRDEVLVVNCLYRMKNVADETMVVNSPRDAVLNLVRRINPDMFIHGVINGTFNAPFFVTRFREALFHFSAGFDMFEATVPREDQDRLMFEKEVFGRDIMNVIACEGAMRVERPETYKQWQVRNRRAGFRQLKLDQEIMKEVRAMVKLIYHKDFVVDEDSNWMLQGWKGRIMYALSCWKPNKGF